MKKIILIMLLCLFTGCKELEKHIIEKNKKTLATSGEEIGILPDGRKVVRYEIERMNHNHYIYVVNGSISMNNITSDGENTTHHVNVTIDGVPYAPAEKESK